MGMGSSPIWPGRVKYINKPIKYMNGPNSLIQWGTRESHRVLAYEAGGGGSNTLPSQLIVDSMTVLFNEAEMPHGMMYKTKLKGLGIQCWFGGRYTRIVFKFF